MSNRTTGYTAEVIGAILANLFVFAVAFSVGAIVGTEPASVDHPIEGGSAQAAENGIQGGVHLVKYVAWTYVISLGLIPLVVSGLGAFLAATLGFVCYAWRTMPRPDP